MNIFKKLKVLKALMNGSHVFYCAGKRYHFESDIKNKDNIELIKEYINEIEKNK